MCISLSLSLSLSEGTMVDEHCSAQWLRKFIHVCMFYIYCMYIYPCPVPSLNKDVTYLLTYLL